MANTSITFTWFNEAANTTDIYVHEMSSAALDRVIEAGRRTYGSMNAVTMLVELASKNKARREMCKDSIKLWKDRTREQEIIVAQDGVAANIPAIDSTEV